MHEFLYTSDQVQKAIFDIFKRGKDGRRIAIVAYIGDSAEHYLPHPNKIEVVCSPTPGATNPRTLRKLIERGATVNFVDGLHMKVYWSEGIGCVVTSANLSINALGIGDLKEAGVLLAPESVDIEKLLSFLQLRPALPELHTLDLAHRDYYKRNRHVSRRSRISFADWYGSPNPEPWKLLICEEFCEDPISHESMNISQNDIGRSPNTWAWCVDGSAIKENEYILCAARRQEDKDDFDWLFVDHVQEVLPEDPAYFAKVPYELIQYRPLETYALPPFTVNAKFKEAFWKAVARIHLEETPSPSSPGRDLLEQLHHLLAEKA